VETGATGFEGIGGDARAGGEVGDVGACADDGAGCFVA